MKKHLTFLLIGLFSHLVSASTVEELVSSLQEYSSYKASFVQTIRSADGRQLQQIEGVLFTAKPNKLYWETYRPYKQILVTEAEKAWFYDVDLEQVTIKKLEEQAQSAPALLLSGEGELIQDQFEVKGVKELNEGGRGWKLSPKEADSLFVSLEIRMQDNLIRRMTIEDALGQVTDIRFSRVELNPDVAPTKFQLSWPEGTDVFDETGF